MAVFVLFNNTKLCFYAHAERSSLNSKPLEDVSLTRNPLSNITNEKERHFVQRRKLDSRSNHTNLGMISL